jgi:type IV secretion system protein VirB9
MSLALRRTLAMGALTTLLAAPALVRAEPDERVRQVEFEPGMVLPLTLFVGYHVHFEFAADERFVNLGAGDASLVDAAAERNHLFLKPKGPSAGTNLTILTDRRVYYVDYRALGRPPKPGELVYAVVFHYPPPPAPTATLLPAPVVPVARAVSNTDYAYAGPRDLRPARAEDDGLMTRLTFSRATELPAVYVENSDGSLSLANTHVEGATVYVHRVVGRLSLRRGGLSGCLVNRGLDRAVAAPDNGTIDPHTERVLREGSP